MGTIVVQSGQLATHELAVHVATHGGHTERTKYLHQQHAQPVAHVRQCQGRRPLLTPVGFTDQELHRDQGQPCGRTREEKRPNRSTVPLDAMSVVVKYMGDTFLNLSYEKQPGHPHKKCSPVPPAGPKRKCLSAGRVESVAV